MKTLLHGIFDEDLAGVHGGQFSIQGQGWKGGRITTPGGNSVNVTPLYTKVSVTNNVANRISNGLNVIAAGSALSCPPVAAAAGIASSMVGLINKGNGVTITLTNPIPGAFITPRK